MNNILIIKNIQIENANAVFGLTSGFPGISHFLGFSHALSRKLTEKFSLMLGGCGVVCHAHEVKSKSYKKFKDPVFTLTKNPLLQDGSLDSFKEEGKMHLNISLIIECLFPKNRLPFDSGSEENDIKEFETYILHEVLKMKLAGGNILEIKSVTFHEMPNSEIEVQRRTKKILYSLLPGFFLINRFDYLKEYHIAKLQDNPQQEIIDSWLDFYTLKYGASKNSSEIDNELSVSWNILKKPYLGYLVPLAVGYQPLTKVLKNDSINNTRDLTSDFCFVEPAYSIGEWKSPHRIENFSDIFWSFHFVNNFYAFFK